VTKPLERDSRQFQNKMWSMHSAKAKCLFTPRCFSREDGTSLPKVGGYLTLWLEFGFDISYASFSQWRMKSFLTRSRT
jgi:hypothetical protein